MSGFLSHLRALSTRRPPTPKERHRAWWACLVGAVAMQVAGAVLLFRTEVWTGASAIATGTVVGHVADSDWKRGTWHKEIVEFTAPDGTPTRFVERAPRGEPFPRGARVPVRFRPSDPTDAAIDSDMRVWEGPVVLLAMGSTGVIVLLLARGRLPSTEAAGG